jgi:hypothetical protein
VARGTAALASALHSLTYSSWLNLVERFFALITDKAIHRGSFRSVRQLITKADHFVTHHNQNYEPFVWTATADSVLAKLQRLCQRISGAGAKPGRTIDQMLPLRTPRKNVPYRGELVKLR